jgi:ferricrocin synthase
MIVRFLDSEAPPYYNSFSIQLYPTTNIDKLRKAWTQVINSTGILRTCFCETSDGYAQVVLKDSDFQWKELVVRDKDIQATISSELDKQIHNNRTLHKVPLYLLYLKTPDRTILVLNIFHALYDGNSLPLILNDVRRAYHGVFQTRPHQFADVVGHLLSVDTSKARKFWEQALSGSKPTNFPEFPDASTQNPDHMAQLRSNVSMERIETICKKLNCTTQAVFQVAWASVLSTYLGSRPVFGIVVSGRSLNFENIEDTIGPLFNTIPCAVNLENASSWDELIRQAHKFYSESIPYHHTPLRLINKWMHTTSEKPLFDTLFVYQRDLKDECSNLPTLWEVSDSSATADVGKSTLAFMTFC